VSDVSPSCWTGPPAAPSSHFHPRPANVHAGETMILRSVAATSHRHTSDESETQTDGRANSPGLSLWAFLGTKRWLLFLWSQP